MHKYGLIPGTNFTPKPGAQNYGDYFKPSPAEECADAIMDLVASSCRISKERKLALGNKIKCMLRELQGEAYGE